MTRATPRLPAEVPLAADAGTGAPTHARAHGGGASNRPPRSEPTRGFVPSGSAKADSLQAGADTLHVEHSTWAGSYRIIQTRPDGTRSVWRRGIPTAEEARLRCLVVADICGYVVVDQ